MLLNFHAKLQNSISISNQLSSSSMIVQGSMHIDNGFYNEDYMLLSLLISPVYQEVEFSVTLKKDSERFCL